MKKHLLGLKDCSAEEIEHILRLAKGYKALFVGRQKSSALQGTAVFTLFYENSTRTRVSFEQAAKALGAGTGSITVASSSVQKGESLIDTALTLKSAGADIIVIRHPSGGAAQFLANNVDISVVNAGDGINEHPTQALLDMLTIQEVFGSFAGLKVAIVGDITHSRVAKSNIYGLSKLGAEVTVCAPYTLLPSGIQQLGASATTSLQEACSGADVVMALRLQLERQQSALFPSVSEYAKYYQVNERCLGWANKNAIIMHPAPLNRGVEISSSVADCAVSVINQQVTNGVAVRMAVLAMCGGANDNCY